MRTWQNPLRIEISEQPYGLRGSVAQYYGLETVAAMKAKLALFAPGTQFLLMARGADTKQAAEEIRKFGASRGLTVTTPPVPGSAAKTTLSPE